MQTKLKLFFSLAFIILFFLFFTSFLNYLKIFFVMAYVMPLKNFSYNSLSEPYDYSILTNWIANPFNNDLIRHLPLEADRLENRSKAVVFFIHPTTYINRNEWNQPKNDLQSKKILNQRILINQASIFSSCCEVYVPRYRQATLYSFVKKNDNATKAHKAAFIDIKNSFNHFNKFFRKDRPFIIAAHSQGSLHGVKLLSLINEDKELLRNFIGGYLVGYKISHSNIAPFKVCKNESMHGCIVAWNSIEMGGFVTFKSKEKLICVNPLSWKEDEKTVDKNKNLGGVGFPRWLPSKTAEESISFFNLEKNLVGAKCKDGNLEVLNLNSKNFPVRLFSLHAYDYGLFYLNIVKNINYRTESFLNK